MYKDKRKQLEAVQRYQATAKGIAARDRYYKKPEVRARRNRQTKAWRKANPALAKKIDRESNHKCSYGEPYEEKIKRLERQGGRCANLGCRTTDPGPKGWQTDHDHVTGKVRGELCGGCNKALGFIHDDEFRAEGLADYVRQHKCVI